MIYERKLKQMKKLLQIDYEDFMSEILSGGDPSYVDYQRGQATVAKLVIDHIQSFEDSLNSLEEDEDVDCDIS